MALLPARADAAECSWRGQQKRSNGRGTCLGPHRGPGQSRWVREAQNLEALVETPRLRLEDPPKNDLLSSKGDVKSTILPICSSTSKVKLFETEGHLENMEREKIYKLVLIVWPVALAKNKLYSLKNVSKLKTLPR